MIELREASMNTRSRKVQGLLEHLSLKPSNAGTYAGAAGWIADSDAERLVSLDPFTGNEIASVLQATGHSYDQAIEAAVQAFPSWRATPAPRRGLLVRDLGTIFREYQEPLGELISLEMGKIRSEGIGEVQEVIDICDFATGLSRQLYGKTMHSERPGHRLYEQWHPLGPTGIITAFNFPAAVWAWNAAIAAVCGNTMVWKPSPITPMVSIAIQHLVNRVCREHSVSGIFNLVIGTNELVGKSIINDLRLPLISFTGSIKVGRQVATKVTERLGKTILELGGNNAIIVTPSADLQLAERAILFAAVGTTGQRCTTARRLIVHESMSDELCSRLVHAYSQLRIGDPLDPETMVGPLVRPEAVSTMMEALDTVQRQGGEIVVGGNPLPRLGPCFVEPAIVRVTEQVPIVSEETFAPILYLIEYKELSQAIEIQNGVPQGLSSSIFTTDLREAEYFLSAAGSDCGIANVNIGTSGAEIGGAFGGEKETGGGREAGSDAWKAYMRRQTATINWSDELPLAQGIRFGPDAG